MCVCVWGGGGGSMVLVLYNYPSVLVYIFCFGLHGCCCLLFCSLLKCMIGCTVSLFSLDEESFGGIAPVYILLFYIIIICDGEEKCVEKVCCIISLFLKYTLFFWGGCVKNLGVVVVDGHPIHPTPPRDLFFLSLAENTLYIDVVVGSSGQLPKK